MHEGLKSRPLECTRDGPAALGAAEWYQRAPKPQREMTNHFKTLD